MRSEKLFPEEWRSVAVKDIAAQLLNGGTPSTEVKEYWKGTIPWVTGADFEDQKLLLGRRHITQEAVKNSATNVVPKGQLLVLTRTGVGKVAEAPTDVAISQDITGLIVEEQHYDRRFIYWQLDRLIPQLGRLKQGTSINGILREDLERFKLPVPKHRETQTQIAQIIDSIDAVIETTRAVIEQIRRLKTALLQDLLTNGLPGWHKKFINTKRLGRIPEDWDIAPLDDLINQERPICYGILMPGRGYPGGVPVVKVKDIEDGKIKLEDLLLTSPELDEEYRRSRLKVGDLLLSIRGTTGRVATVPVELEGANITQDTARIAVENTATRDYLYYEPGSTATNTKPYHRASGQRDQH